MLDFSKVDKIRQVFTHIGGVKCKFSSTEQNFKRRTRLFNRKNKTSLRNLNAVAHTVFGYMQKAIIIMIYKLIYNIKYRIFALDSLVFWAYNHRGRRRDSARIA